MKKITITIGLLFCLSSFNNIPPTTLVDCNDIYKSLQLLMVQELNQLREDIKNDFANNKISGAIALDYGTRLNKNVAMASHLSEYYHATLKPEYQPFQFTGETAWCNCQKQLK